MPRGGARNLVEMGGSVKGMPPNSPSFTPLCFFPLPPFPFPFPLRSASPFAPLPLCPFAGGMQTESGSLAAAKLRAPRRPRAGAPRVDTQPGACFKPGPLLAPPPFAWIARFLLETQGHERLQDRGNRERFQLREPVTRSSGSVTRFGSDSQDRRRRQGSHSGLPGRRPQAPPRGRSQHVHRAQGELQRRGRAHFLEPFSAHREDRGREQGRRSPRAPLLLARPSGQGRSRQGSEGQLSAGFASLARRLAGELPSRKARDARAVPKGRSGEAL